MIRRATVMAATAILLATAHSAALAANSRVLDMAEQARERRAELLTNYPDFETVDEAIRTDCAAKVEGEAASGPFCDCGAALVMTLWTAGADPKMLPRLNAYLEDPTEAAAQDLLSYQGAELYRPLCSQAVR
ncbi:hypothetical protein B5C34_03100 [Pacificimonas flava]|uniref:Uncharacterized protein n=2 Tax=Pacificimonas TaxID=1960290 RepID=A0A219B315_9SPHN|nr:MULTISPECIES: hypothetical protein [Pacificimonas]MBZ6377794.1 hypothetical protein [Pacificimonas aurantium]OWV32536.1 hypothetical protein B5C34_03100 [Pacificimonas flava]